MDKNSNSENHIRRRYYGLDVLRGTGVVFVIVIHSAFYYYSGLFDIDFDNPPLIITVIGFLLMFAGMFAMVSGASHTVQAIRKLEYGGFTPSRLTGYFMASGAFILTVAYLYFIITGPGMIDFESRSMDTSLMVQLIQGTGISGISQERVLYVDSLVMIGMNIVFLGLIEGFVFRVVKGEAGYDFPRAGRIFLISGVAFFVISLSRIPLYSIYMDAVDAKNWPVILMLNWLVNKNNPLMPFLSFGLFGAWIGCLLAFDDFHRMSKRVLPAGIIMLVLGTALYMILPDTMLRRVIDPKWYSIMIMQLGLFMIVMLLMIRLFDFGADAAGRRNGFASSFVMRFGVAGLTAFFLETVVSAAVFRVMSAFFDVSFNIPQALVYGVVLALIWGTALVFWEKRSYKYSLEYWYCRFLKGFGGSEKEKKLEGGSP